MAQTTNHLRIQGTLDLSQFWPDGKSDADTSKLVLAVAGSGVQVQLAGQTRYRATRAYDAAVVATGTNADGEPVTKPVINAKGQLTVRLQRIDAPELHYRPDARGSGGKLKGTGLIKDYRQHQAETATVRLAQYLASFGQDPLPCAFSSVLPAAGGPGEAIDKYGRFVGDIILPDHTNLNLWLLRSGLSVIALYDSMLPEEIEESLAAWNVGRQVRGSVARCYDARFPAFDPQLQFRPVGSRVQAEGNKRFLHPKFYRRQVTWWAFREAGAFDGDFADWLEGKEELCHQLDEFRARGRKAPRYPLYERAADGKAVGWAPEDFIFLEAPSRLLRADGRTRVSGW